MESKLTVLSTGDNIWQEEDAILVKHIVTGEVMAFLDYFGDGYGAGRDAEVGRYNDILGTYEKVRLPRKSLTAVKNLSYAEQQSNKLKESK